MAKDFNNRLITPELEKAMQDYPLYSQEARRRMQFASQCFSSARHHINMYSNEKKEHEKV